MPEKFVLVPLAVFHLKTLLCNQPTVKPPCFLCPNLMSKLASVSLLWPVGFISCPSRLCRVDSGDCVALRV